MIIEIAGGREIYSQSRTKAIRKGRHAGINQRSIHQRGAKHRGDKDTYDSIYINETNLNHRRDSRDTVSPALLPSSFPVQHSPPTRDKKISTTIPIQPSPSPPPIESPPPLTPPDEVQGSKGSPIAVTAGGELVVFDDIGDSWQSLRLDLENSEPDIDNGIQRTVTVENSVDPIIPVHNNNGNTGKSSPMEDHSDETSDGSCSSEEHDGGLGNGVQENDVGNGARVARVIGGVPIAEYAESPRRYGPPRPGFPQRVLSGSSPSPPLAAPPCLAPSSMTFDYLYEFSETRKVLEEFFKCPKSNDIDHDTGTLDDINDFQDLDYELRRHQKRTDDDIILGDGDVGEPEDGDIEDGDERADSRNAGSWYVGQRLAKPRVPAHTMQDSPQTRHNHTNFLGLQQDCDPYEPEVNLVELSVGTGSSGSGSRERRGGGMGGTVQGTIGVPTQQPPHRFTLSPETTDCDSNCGDLDSEVSLMLMENEIGANNNCNSIRVVPCMPVLEDGLSSGHASDVDNNSRAPPPPAPAPSIVSAPPPLTHATESTEDQVSKPQIIVENGVKSDVPALSDVDLNNLDPLDFILASRWSMAPPPPAPEAHRGGISVGMIGNEAPACAAALRDIRLALRRARALPPASVRAPEPTPPTLWLPRRRDTSRESVESTERKPASGDDDEADTDLETDRLLGQQRTDDQGFYDEKGWRKGKSQTMSAANTAPSHPPTPPAPPPAPASPPSTPSPGERPEITDTPATDIKHKKDKDSKKKGKNKEVLIEGVLFRARYLGSTQLVCEGQPTKATRMLQAEEAVSRIKDTNACVQATNQHLIHNTVSSAYDGVYGQCGTGAGEEMGNGEVSSAPPISHSSGPTGTVFRLAFLGSVEVDEEGSGRRRRKRLKKNMVEEAVTKIKAPEGESQPSTEVDLFISTEKIMVLNTDLKEIMMDHALRTISYIADIGDLVVLMARRRFVPHELDDPPKVNRTPKMICHVFESEEAQFIAQSIGQAFQVAYMEFLKANGIEDHSFVKEMDYQEVLNSQEIFGDELQMFAKKEMQKEVVVPKAKGEILGVVIVESGWGSMLPTVVIANLAPSGAAARCGQLNIGDQIIAINGVSLVGLPLSTCQTYIKNSKNQTVVKLTVVPCAPVVEVKIKRPDTKYQLGFSVQNGVICSLLRGGIAERGGVRVGHRIIEINNQSVVAVPHERIVNLLATSVGEILMKTMPTSMFRLLTGQENPVYI
ncbi:uncharacterized protein LOC143911524 isoform X4 [Arctopsyche grandis]|uniref:uncharacterized protein LOC143911524 isoform X4 n=1 Tax=Arctopsyche grandis TaxID=121162 RepID=UPI00406D9382